MTTTLPSVHCFSVEDYYGLAEAGVLASYERVELLEGLIIDMMPIGLAHVNSVRRFNNFFAKIGGDRWLVDVQNPVHLDGGSEPQPDFVLLLPLEEEYETRLPTPQDVILLVEVADSSIRYDRRQKLAVYAKASIREYWIVNLVDRMVEVHRRPLPTGVYESVFQARDQDQIAPEAFPDVLVTVSNVLRADPQTH